MEELVLHSKKYIELLQKGRDYLQKIEEHLKKERRDQVKFVSSYTNSDELVISVFAQTIVIKLKSELSLLDKGIALIAAYHVEYNDSTGLNPETKFYEMEYDKIGNLNRAFTNNDFVSPFEKELFAKFFERIKGKPLTLTSYIGRNSL